MRRVTGSPMPLAEFRRRVAIARSGVDAETAAGEAWATALKLSVQVAEDLQGVFLMLAVAAIRAEPCPSDARIARAYGTHSARRARRLLGYFEEQELIIVHADHRESGLSAFRSFRQKPHPGRRMRRTRMREAQKRRSNFLLQRRRECDWPRLTTDALLLKPCEAHLFPR
jgi:hypothetical protein